jgi:hypothetical protein
VAGAVVWQIQAFLPLPSLVGDSPNHAKWIAIYPLKLCCVAQLKLNEGYSDFS